ncbi:MAG: hypothetical protein HQM12_12255 [SAR324 cluster bacterium]|nr:hypothetical protein [SAR324 cluster bacterium]
MGDRRVAPTADIGNYLTNVFLVQPVGDRRVAPTADIGNYLINVFLVQPVGDRRVAPTVDIGNYLINVFPGNLWATGRSHRQISEIKCRGDRRVALENGTPSQYSDANDYCFKLTHFINNHD